MQTPSGSPAAGTLPSAAYIAVLVLAIVGVIALVLTNASESTLVDFSYLLVPVAVFGLAGLAFTRGRFKPALVWAVASLLLLFVFMVVIFPML